LILPDVNVLIYAFRSDTPRHALCQSWLTAELSQPAPFGLSPQILSAVVRITTNSRVYKNASSSAEAFAFCDYLRDQPHCRVIEPGPRHWQIFRDLCTNTGITGAGTTDAWFAALAIEAGCEFITMDRDFARFPGLRWRTPG
jgi:toxin-antitoxin system PIN domain toxin